MEGFRCGPTGKKIAWKVVWSFLRSGPWSGSGLGRVIGLGSGLCLDENCFGLE